MNGLIRASLRNPYAVTVLVLTILILGGIALRSIPVDILPVFNAPAVQALTFYSGMPAESIEKDITARMERWTGQAAGTARQESRSIVGASIIRNYYRSGTDPNGALTQVNSLATAAIPGMPPGTLPPVVLPFDPTSTVPVCLVALDSKTQSEAILYDTGRYEVRNFIMSIPGAVAPVVYGGKVRAVLAYLDREKLEARNLSPLDVMNALDHYNLFLPTGDAKFGKTDYALDSNSMYDLVDRMGNIPIKTEHGNAIYLRDVATPKDASFIQTNIVRVNGRPQVYIPVFRQLGMSTLDVVSGVKKSLPDMEARLSRPDIGLHLVMDQSVYVRASISALAQEGLLGALLCSTVILLFLGEWRMTMIAITTIPVSVLGAIVCLYASGMTINVMTLAGLALAIGPLVDSAIICLENTHRHLGFGLEPKEAAFLGASEVAMPELISTLCTFLVLAPLALMPGMGEFLFRPMAYAVAFAMICAYFLSRTFVPCFSALLLKSHGTHAVSAHGGEHGEMADDEEREEEEEEESGVHAGEIQNLVRRGFISRAFGHVERSIDRLIALYVVGLGWALNYRRSVVVGSYGSLVVVLVVFTPILRREFFPEVDAGAFEIYVRAPSGTRIEVTQEKIAGVEKFIREQVGPDLDVIVSELGVTPDWSAAYTPNSGPMDAVVKVQLHAEREHSAQDYVERLRSGFAKSTEFSDLDFAFDAGGMIRGAMNEGKSTPINVRILGKNLHTAHEIAAKLQQQVAKIDGVVDCRIMQRLDYPEYVIDVDRAKAADLGLDQSDVMKNVVAAFNSSIQFNKHNFWIDPLTHNQYFVGVQYPEKDITSIQTLLDIPITSPVQNRPIPLKNIVSLRRASVPAEVTHSNLQPTIDLTMGVSGRDLGHVSDDVAKVLDGAGKRLENGLWAPYDPHDPEKTLKGSKITLSGEYARMQDTFHNLAIGLVLATLLMYFLMVALDRSWIVPMTVMLVVPLCLVGVLPMLYFTGTALNVQSLLGIIFIVGIKVANTVLMTDFAQELRRHEGLSPIEAIRKSASIRVRPVTMTALAAFFAMVPAALAIERGSEANAPLARAILGGLLAGEPATLFVLPALYSLMVRDKKERSDQTADHAEPAATLT
ncbi:MAG TPA: efflux RND transporter permease subunit [Pirellulales bacterium]|jgi:multidrug efflux pump subunit AcrB|nr:efflux RND transporter permease subunit [Pirellulales bacterium]